MKVFYILFYFSFCLPACHGVRVPLKLSWKALHAYVCLQVNKQTICLEIRELAVKNKPVVIFYSLVETHICLFQIFMYRHTTRASGIYLHNFHTMPSS